MIYAANDNLEEDITALAARHYTSATGLALHTFFNCLAMPVPLKSEITPTSDMGFILFLNEPAILIRISSPEYCPSFIHDRILQPFGSAPVDKLRADFFPGVITPIKQQSVEKVAKELRKDNVSFADQQTFNCGYIPMLDDHGVVIDMGAVRRSRIYDSGPIQLALNKARMMITRQTPQAPLQEKYYHSLRQAFKAAWPDTSDEPDHTKLTAMWQECMALKDQGKLVAGWLHHVQNGYNFKNLNGSTRYAQRWSPPKLSEPSMATT
jgi:hypothetical protein